MRFSLTSAPLQKKRTSGFLSSGTPDHFDVDFAVAALARAVVRAD